MTSEPSYVPRNARWQSWLWPLLGLVAIVQSAALFKMVYDRDRLLKVGREVIVPTQPLDPRDIFRGDYVTLGYNISTVTGESVGGNTSFEDVRPGSYVYVTLAPDAAGEWKLTNVSQTYPKEVAPSDIVLRALVKNVWRADDKTKTQLVLRYGIETYFVPEGTGRALEDKVRTHKVEAIVAVGADGAAALKGLVVDGERHVDPPLL